MGCKLTDHDGDSNTADIPTCTGYELRADIDLDTNGNGYTWTGTEASPTGDSGDAYYNGGAGWLPIGKGTVRSFINFEGNGHTISNLFIRRGGTHNLAFFGDISGEEYPNLTYIRGVGMKNALVHGRGSVGILVGRSDNAFISASWSTGAVRGDESVGGLVGSQDATSILASYSLASVTATNYGGGLLGSCLAYGIKGSYAGGEIEVSGLQKGGLVKLISIYTCIQSGDNLYNTDTTTLSTSNIATGKTDAELRVPTGYTGIYQNWNVDVDNADGDHNINTGRDDPWSIVAGRYPVLKYGAGASIAEQVAEQLTVASGSTAADLSSLALSAGSLSPTFARDTAAYTATLPAATTSLTLTPTAVTSGATITINGTTVTSGSAFSVTVPAVGESTTYRIVVIASGMVRVYTVAVTRLQDYDDDDDGLIDIRTHQQLNAVRWDLNGNGVVSQADEGSGWSSGNDTSYNTAFPNAAAGMGCKLTDHDNNQATDTVPTCTGYELRADIDLDTDEDGNSWTGSEASPTGDSGDAYNNSGSGWEPIGTATASFHTTFNGNGHTISNLFINRGNASNTGLFGHIGIPSNNYTRIEAVGLRNVLVIGNTSVGALVGRSGKPVTASWATGAVIGETQVGGLVGSNTSSITASYSLASVRAGTTFGGGLIGQQVGGSITASYAGGEVTGGGVKGGLVASVSGSPTDTNNYYNSTTTALNTSALGTAKTDTELRAHTGYTDIYANWDVDVGGTNAADDPWHIIAGSYPVLDYGAAADTTEQMAEQLPVAPTGLTAAAGDAKVLVFWTHPNNAAINGYQYQQKVGAGNYSAWTSISDADENTTSHTFESLTNGTMYQYNIRARTNAGGGSATETTAATPATDSTAPTLGTVADASTDGMVSGSNRYLQTGETVIITVPVVDQNPPATAPTVSLKFGSAGTERSPTAAAPVYTVNTGQLTATYTYSYDIVSGDTGTLRYKVTGVADSASSSNSMTDQAAFTEIATVQANVGAVTGLLAAPGNAQAELVWTAEGAGFTGWQYDKKAGNGSWDGWTAVPSATAATRTYIVPSLTNGTNYTFKVRTTGPGVGDVGTESAEAYATPNTGITAVDFDSDTDNLIAVSTHQQLNAIRWDLDGNGIPDTGTATADIFAYYNAFSTSRAALFCVACAGYELTADIDLDTDGDNDGTYTGNEASPTADADDAYYNSGTGWAPIGHQPSAAFHATFNGNGYTISNLFINRTATYTGLFGFTGRPSNSHTRIEGVGLKNAYVKGGGTTGALVGRNEKPVTASWVTGAVRGANGVGGLIGLNTSTVTASYSLASVTATNTVGGLIGQQENGSIIASYAGGKVSTAGATKGGLVASKSGTASATDAFYNSDTAGLSASALGVAKTDAALRTPTGYTGIYADWDVDIDNADTDDDLTTGGDDPWHITAGNYPVLDYGTGASTTTQTNEQPAVPATPSIVRHNPADAVHTDLTPTFRVSSLTEDAVITLHTDSACVNAALTTTPMTPTVAAGDTNKDTAGDTNKDIDSTFVVGSYTVYAKQTLNNCPFRLLFSRLL